MGAAILRRYGIAIGRQKAVGIGGPCHSPLAGSVGTDASGFAGEDVRVHQGVGVDRGAKIILQPARKVKTVLGRHVVDALQQCRVAVPADLDATEQIGLGAGHLEQALRLEGGLGAEDLGVGPEADFGAAAGLRACPWDRRARTPCDRASGRGRLRPRAARKGRSPPTRRRRASHRKSRRPWNRTCRRNARCT